MQKQRIRRGDVRLSHGDSSVEVDLGDGKGVILSLKEGQWVQTGSSGRSPTSVKEDYAIGHIDDLSNIQEELSRLDLSRMEQVRQLKQREDEEAQRERLETG